MLNESSSVRHNLKYQEIKPNLIDNNQVIIFNIGKRNIKGMIYERYY